MFEPQTADKPNPAEPEPVFTTKTLGTPRFTKHCCMDCLELGALCAFVFEKSCVNIPNQNVSESDPLMLW